MTTINYYEKNADEFFESSVNASMDEVADKFLKLVKPGGKILDAGCGSGRDALYFLNRGYEVAAFDLSPSLVAKASALTGIKVQVMGFMDLNVESAYDGVWACSSLLHLEEIEVEPAFNKLITALKPNGILYASFKYGESSGERNGRFFTDMTEEKLRTILNKIEGLSILELWKSEDVRQEKKGEMWVNVIGKNNKFMKPNEAINQLKLENGKGIYYIKFVNKSVLKEINEPFYCEYENRVENEIVYIGIANGKGELHERLCQEFRQISRGTFFRSIGAIIVAIPREGQASPRNYMFYGEEKEKIINFINENLLVAYEIIHQPNKDIETKEQELIKKLCPIFNITHNPNKSMVLKLARAKCREIAGR